MPEIMHQKSLKVSICPLMCWRDDVSRQRVYPLLTILLYRIKMCPCFLILELGASVAEWLRSLTSNHLPLTSVGSNLDRDFGFFRGRKLSS
jgi:hypothetical protein